MYTIHELEQMHDALIAQLEDIAFENGIDLMQLRSFFPRQQGLVGPSSLQTPLEQL